MIASNFLPWLLLRPTPALAVDPCAIMGGCPSGNYLWALIQPIGTLLISVGAGAAVIGVVIGGATMLLNFGDESKVEKGRKAVIYSLAGFAIVLGSQALTSFVYSYAFPVAAVSGPTLVEDVMAAAVTAMYSLFNIVFLIVITFAGYKMVIGRGQADEFNRARTMLIWAIGGAIVINAARAIVTVIMNVFL